MSEELTTTTPSLDSTPTRRRAVLVQEGDRLVASDRQFHPLLAAEYIRDHGGRTRWVPVGELARVFYMRDSKSNRQRIRVRMYRIWNALLDAGCLLVYELDGSRIEAVKLFDARLVEEQQALHARLARMQKQRFLKNDQVEKALALAAVLDTLASEP